MGLRMLQLSGVTPMAIVIGGHENGLLNSSFTLLDRNDRTHGNDPGHGEQIFANVSNGNLTIQHRDVFMPSRGDDYLLVRTYNARGRASDAHQHDDARWTWSTWVRLDVRKDHGEQYFEVEYGDGSLFDYRFDAETGLYVSTDGAGAFETIEDLGAKGNQSPAYILTRADGDRLAFDRHGQLVYWEDTNGVRTEFIYNADRLVQVRDDQGHVINYIYESGHLARVVDETEGVLVKYEYDQGRLSEVIDRFGHRTQYFYTHDGFLERIVLPYKQDADGDGRWETYETRELLFEYDDVNWQGDTSGRSKVVTQIIDAEGGITTFDYDFQFGTNGAGKSNGNGNGNSSGVSGGKPFDGGTTRVVDALGNKRAYSNDEEYVEWRLDNGYYEFYNAHLADKNPVYRAQVESIRNRHSLTYSYRDDGYITEVVDQKGFHTAYAYDEDDNLIAVTDPNGWGVTASDSAYYRQLRFDLGVVDAAGNGKRVAELTWQEIDELTEAFTSHFEYDNRGNLIKSIDNADNVTTFTYTSFNKVESSTSAVGNALLTSDELQYRDKRVELGYASLAADLSDADKQAILALYTTRFEYDARQNLVELHSSGGDITRFEYDQYGNRTRQIVFLDPGNLIDPALQQVTEFSYDLFGNNTQTVDAEGNITRSQFDHFGNRTRFIDGNGGETQFTYDADNRLLTITDPEGHTTVNTYDAVGNRISVTDANGHTVKRIYDRNNNLIVTIDPSESYPSQNRVTRFEYDVVGNRTSTVDAEGRRTEFRFNERRELVESITAAVVAEDGVTPVMYSSTFAYDGTGNRIRTTNNRGYTTEILYTQNNLIRQQTDPNGHVTRFVYDADNNQVQIIAGMQLTPALRQILKFSYDEEDQLISQTDAEGNVTTFAYDAPGNRIAAVDANGHATEFEYDGNNRLIREIRPEVIDPQTGAPVRYTVEHIYDANGNEIETVDENGHRTRFSFDKDNQVVMVEDANGIKTVFEYDSRHNRTAVMIGVDASVDAAGGISVGDVSDAQITRFIYDEFNQLIAQTDGMGNALAQSDSLLYQQMRQELGFSAQVADLSAADRQALRDLYTRHYDYDRVGNKITDTDKLGRTTRFEYDALNRLVKRTDALGQATELRYDGNGNRVEQIDALGRSTIFAYDEVDRLTDTTDPLGVATHRGYDDFGNLVAETRAFGTGEAHTREFIYDLNNRVVQQIDPEGNSRHFEYDAVGNRIRVVDGRGNASQFFYDALNRNVKILDPLNFEAKFEYDGVGNRIALIDARGGITRFDYDPGNRQIRTTDAEGRVTTFAYDLRGNRIEQRTAAGTVDEELTVFEYDAENNLRRVIDAEGGVVENDYDRVYNRTAVADQNGNTTFTEFDALNRSIRIIDALGGEQAFTYDAVSNRLSQTDPLGRVTTFEYDADNRLIVQTAPDGVQTHFTYDLVGNRVSVTRAANTADAAIDTFSYDQNDRLVAQADALGNTTRFEHDENGNITRVIDPNGNVTVNTYDANNQLIFIDGPEGDRVRFAYDGNGNRIQVIDGRGFAQTTYYNANNEVSLQVDAEGYATSFEYDNNGNVVSRRLHMQALSLPLDPATEPAVQLSGDDQLVRFEYDKLNRITARVDGEGYRTEFVYDAVGNRLETHQFRDLAGNDVAVTRSFYDNLNREVLKITAEGYLTERRYDAVGNEIQRMIFDPAPVPGNAPRIETFEYDAVNRLTRRTSALGVHTDFEYDRRGNRLAQIDAAGTAEARRTGFVYDRTDRLVDTIDALGTVTHRVLDANGNMVEFHEAFGTTDQRVTRFVYDGNNRQVREVNALGVVIDTVYDANGNVNALTTAAGLSEARAETFEYDRNNRRIALVNGEGERTEFVYDGAGNRIRQIQAPGLAEERINVSEYDRDNRLAASIDGEGVRTQFRYDGAGNLLETIEAAGVAGEERRTVNVYDLDNRLLQTTDPLGGVTSYEYDVLGNRIRITDANGGVQKNMFDAIGRLVSSLTAAGTLIINQYDLRNNLVSATTSFEGGGDARTTVRRYDLLDRQISVTGPEGFTTESRYDVFGNAVSVTRGLYSPQPGDSGYDANKAAKAFPQTTTSEYDAADRLIRRTAPLGTVTVFDYDAVGNRIAVTDAAGTGIERTTTFRYDLANRLLETIDPEGGVTRNTYDALGQAVAKAVLQSDDGAGNQVWINQGFEYDDNGRLIAQIDGEGVRTEFEYDAVGNRILMRAAAGTGDERVTRMEFDLNNRIVAEIDGEGNRAESAYDAVGNLIRRSDPRGGNTYYYYDGDNQLVAQLNAGGFLQQFDYDSIGNRIEQREFFSAYNGAVDAFSPPVPDVSAHDRITRFAYDGNSRVVSRIDADGTVTSFEYDALGNQIQETDALGRMTAFEYDANNRLIAQTAADGVETRFTYDAVGNRTAIVRAANTADISTRNFEYDLNNRLVREIDGVGGVKRFGYDKAGNRISETDANGNVTGYQYDANNRLRTALDGEGRIIEFRYDAVGNRIRQVDARGSATNVYYDDNNRVMLSVDAEGYATSFVYDANGNVITQTLHMEALSLPLDPSVQPAPPSGLEDQVTRFEYDALNRVTARIDAEGYRTEFIYDAAGNRLQTRQFRDLSGSDVAVIHKYYDAMDHEIAMVTAEGYLVESEYDAMGNLIRQTGYDRRVTAPGDGPPQPEAGDSGRTQQFSYDAVNRLVQEASVLGVNTVFEYDSRGNRIAVIEAAGTADERRTRFTYDAADRLIDSIDALGNVSRRLLDAAGNVLELHEAFGTADERLTRFEYDANNRLVREINALGVVSDIVYDGNGNVVVRTSAAGLPEARSETFEYDRNNRRIAEVNGEGERTEYRYDGAGNRVQLTLAAGRPEARVNVFEFDRDNRMVAGIDGEGVRTEYRYDGAGNKVETVQAVGVAGQQRSTVYAYDLDNRLIRIVDPMGGVTSYEYDALGNQTRIINANGGVQENAFDALGRHVSTLSAGGTLTVNHYDRRGNIVSTTQSFADGSDARTTTYRYDLLDRQTRITDPEGFSTSIGYDAFGNQLSVTHGQYLVGPADSGYDAGKAARAFPQTNTFTYDAADRMLSLTDGEGNVSRYGYDAVGNRISFTEAANAGNARTTVFRYDLANRLIETVNPEGGIARNSYDAAGNKITESILQSDSGASRVWTMTNFEYDGNARVVAQTDGEGVRTEFEYDAMGNRTLVRAAAGTPDQRITRKEYDLNNRVIAEIDGEGGRSEFAYDAMGNRIRATDALGRVARFYMDGANRLVTVLDAEGFVNEFRYDSAGNRIEERVYFARYTGPVNDFTPPVPASSAADRLSSSIYDGNGRVTMRTEADGSTTEFTYDATGNLLHEVQFANTATPHELFYEYDANNRLIRFTDVDGTVTEFEYDAANNKTAETILNAGDRNSVRRTEFEYDLNNRQIREIFDPAGLNFVQETVYDRLGNAIEQVDANGSRTRFEYDLNNRVVRKVDPLGSASVFAYDAVGNRISVTDARGFVTGFEYDANNRMVREILPEAQVYTVDGGLETVRAVVQRSYDAAGNEVQTIDANGSITTCYFNSNDRLVAEINGGNVLREFAYNAAGDQVSETFYMTRLPSTSHNPGVRPVAPSGASRVTQREYDLGGRLTGIVHQAIQITVLSNTDTDTPIENRAMVNPEEHFIYDAFGNQVETIDANGNRTVAYYDVKGRLVAQVDAEGYLTEWDYDAQDNVLEQRIYLEALDPAAVNPDVRPNPPAGEVYQVNRTYDAASHLIEERSPQVRVFDPNVSTSSLTTERVVTRFTYDALGNELSKTLAAGTSQESVEYSYYDALGRRIAIIDGNRVLNLFAYDGNGNQTFAKRYFTQVPGSIDPAALSGDTNFATLVGGSSTRDQAIQRSYDALNRLSGETELMGPGGADDLTRTFRYDANGQRTWSRDEDGFITQFSYDALGNVVATINPDHSGTVAEYDAAGNVTFLYTGVIGNQALPATNLSATQDTNGLLLSWDLNQTTDAPVQSYVVYDTVSRADPDGYAHRTATLGTWFSDSASVQIDTGDFNPGDVLYVRVVTRDTAGNLAWTEEFAAVLPPSFNDVTVRQPAAETLEVEVEFGSGISNPRLLFGASGSPSSSISFVDQGGGIYAATLTGVTNPQELVYRLQWQDANGNTFTGNETPFEAPGDHTGVTTELSQTTVIQGGETRYRVNAAVNLPAAFAQNQRAVIAEWTQIGGNATGSTSVSGVDDGSGIFSFNLVLGDESPLPAGDYQVTLRALGASESVVVDAFQLTLGGSDIFADQRGLSWAAPAGLNAALVIVNGRNTAANIVEGRLVVDVDGLGAGDSAVYDIFYGSQVEAGHTTNVVATEVTETDDTVDPPVTTTLGYDLGINVDLSAGEAATISGDLRLAWRPASSGSAFANETALSASGSTYSTTLSLLEAGDYDLKLFYTDVDGNEVVVDWLRVDSTAGQAATQGHSLVVQAREVNGEISVNADGVFDVDPGLFLGALGDLGAQQSLPVGLAGTGNTGGSRSVDGRDTGYFTENRYNAMNHRIATNEQTGVWREFGVDANGNIVATYEYGEEGAADAHVSYSTYDGRDRKTADFSPEFVVSGQTAASRTVTRYEYDASDNLVRQIDANGTRTERTYNALGKLLTETRRLAGGAVIDSREQRYDRLGNLTAEIDGLGKVHYKFYDAAGRMVRERDGEGNDTTYGYDAFDRRLSVTNALGDSVQMRYDQRDRLIGVTDGEGHNTTYAYDGRNNRTVTTDANGHRFEQVWDSMGRVVQDISVQNGRTISTRKQYDVYGNLVAETDEEGRVSTSVYGKFGRLVEEVDAGGRRTLFDYDRFGRQIRQWREETTVLSTGFFGSGSTTVVQGPYGPITVNTGATTTTVVAQDIRREYDALGRLLLIDDLRTGVSTRYEYDVMGNRRREIVDAPTDNTNPDSDHDRDITYAYDAVGQMVRWADSRTGLHLSYLYDAAGNLARTYTDAGYDPENQGLAANERFIDHWYSYDGNNRVRQIRQGNTLLATYGYDAAGNRTSYSDRGNPVSYQYDGNGQVTRANWTDGGASFVATWTYDNVGNVLTYQVTRNGELQEKTVRSYYENNRLYKTVDTSRNDDNELKTQTTTQDLDRSGRIVQTTLVDGDKTFYFDHHYFQDGRESSTTGHGKASGTSRFTYDANDKLVTLDKGKGDGQDNNEILRFVYNNDGQILYRFHNQGDDDLHDINTEFAYANGNPVGETGNDQDGKIQVELDTGRYSPVQNLGEDFPASTVTFFTAGAGATLQSVAAAVYGNPSLWFVIAEANGLQPGDSIPEGMRLQIPNSVKSGHITANTHTVYNESDIIGSTLPNLKSPPPKKGCGSLLAIIIIVVIAVVATILTAGLAGVFLGAAGTFLGLTGTAATIAAFAVAGAIVGAAASIVQQGLFIALGYQEKFSWKSVAAGAVSGAFAGAAQGLGQAAQAAAAVGKTVKYAKTASAALKVASVASKQLIENGKITSWTSLAAAGIGGALSADRAIQQGTLEQAQAIGSQALAEGANKTLATLDSIQTAVDYITPWVELAETAIRNDGELTAGDWISAVGGTLGTALRVDPEGNELGDRLGAATANVAISLAIGGAVSLFDKDAALDWAYNAVGNEIGQFIGQTLTIDTGLQDKVNGRLADLRGALAAGFIKADQRMAQAAAPTSGIPAGGEEFPEGVIIDPTTGKPLMLASNGLPPGVEALLADDEADAGEAGLLAELSGENEGEEAVLSTVKVGQGDSLWKIAKGQLPADASNADIQRQVQILMELNPGVDPRALQIGQELTVVQPNSGLEVSETTLAAYRESDSEYQTFLADKRAREAVIDEADTTVSSAGISQLTEEQLFALFTEAVKNKHQGEIDALKNASLDELKANRDKAFVITEKELQDFEAAIKRDPRGGEIKLTGEFAKIAEAQGFDLGSVTEYQVVPSTVPTGQVISYEVPALSTDQAKQFLEVLQSSFAFDYEEGTQRRLVFVPEGVTADEAKKAVLFDIGRRAEDTEVALVFDAIDQAVAGGGGFVDTTIAFNQSVFNTIQERLKNSSTDDFLRQQEKQFERTFEFHNQQIEQLTKGSFLERLTAAFALQSTSEALQGQAGAVFVASEVDRIDKDIDFSFDENAPAGLREDAQSELILEGALLVLTSAAEIVGVAAKAFQAAKTIARGTRNVIRGLREGELALRTPILLDEAALAGRLNSGIPLDALKFRNPLVRKALNPDTFRATDAFLKGRGVTDPVTRQKIINSGLRSELLGADTPLTNARFNKLFIEPLEQGKSFRGRLGNIDTRVETINRAAELERSGLRPRFEFEVDVSRVSTSNQTRSVDLVGVNPQTGDPARFIQFVKQNRAGTVIRTDELTAAREIEQALKLRQGTVELINTGR